MCNVVKFVVAIAIPPQHRLASSSNSLLIQLLWSLDTFIQICPLPFMALTHQSFNIFSSAPGHFHTQELQSHFVFTYGKVLLSENSSLVLDQITFSKMTTFEMPFEIMLYKEKKCPSNYICFEFETNMYRFISSQDELWKSRLAATTVLLRLGKNIHILILS